MLFFCLPGIKVTQLILFIVLYLFLKRNHAFQVKPFSKERKQPGRYFMLSKEKQNLESLESTGFLGKIAFSLTEVLAKIQTNVRDNGDVLCSTEKDTSVSLDSLALRLQQEYEKVFWATGNMDTTLYAENCIFADPFSSFGGSGSVKRFKRNADSLGRLIINPKAKVRSVDINAKLMTITIEWTFSSQLSLPWRPTLAASGYTTHYINETNGKIFKYEERWISKPLDVVFRLFKPSSI